MRHISLKKGSVPKMYAHINFTPPKSVMREAQRGLKLRRQHGRGGLSNQQASAHGIGSGVQRAVTLASGGRVSPGTIKRMRSFFARHSAYKEHHKDRTSAAYISWLLWGGDAGERWANKVYAQMMRADEEMKKAVAGGEQAGHKYIRRIRTARNGRMGWRYIYKRPQGTRPQKDSADRLTETQITNMGIDIIARSTSPLGDTEEGLATQLDTGTYVLLNTDSILTALQSEDENIQLDALMLVDDQLSDLETDWLPEDLADTLLSPDIDHTSTLRAITEAPMGEQEPLSFDDTTVIDEEPPVSEESGVPDLEAAAEQHNTLIETLRETPELEPLADAIDVLAPVKDGKINLPVKAVGKAIALLTLITAVETYKTVTVENDSAPDLNELEGASRRGLKQIDKDKIAEAKAKMRESLNKERQEARDKMTRERLAARLKEQEARAKASMEREGFRVEQRIAQEERKEARKKATEERREAAKERAKQKAAERREASKEKTAKLREASKEKTAELREAAKEKAAERKEAQKRRDATRKKAEEERAAKRKRSADLRKKAESERKEAAKEKADARKEAAKEKVAERKKVEAERKKVAKEKADARKEAAKEKTAERKKVEAERKEKLKREEREHKEKLKRETVEHKEKLKRETAEHKERLRKEAAEQRERIRASKAPKKVAKKQPKKTTPSTQTPKVEETKKEEPKSTSSTPKERKKSSAKGKRRKKGRWRKSTFLLTRQRMTDETTP